MSQTSFSSSLSVGSYLLDSLYRYGVEHIFGIPGDYVLQFDKLIEQHPHITYIGATRENPAGYMADAYGRLRGMGAVCITYGVGINIANALSQASVESSPLVVISGTAGMADFTKGQKLHHLLNKRSVFHQMDTTQSEIFSHFTIDQAILTSPLEAKAQIDRVLWNCYKKKRPVYIELPRDIALQNLPIDSQNSLARENSFLRGTYLSPSTPTCRAATFHPLLDKIEQMLNKCQRPVIWAGHEISRHQLSAPLLTFAEKYHIPIVSTLLGKTAVNEAHPLFLGVYQGVMSAEAIIKHMEEADGLILLGAILNDVDTGIFTAKLDHPHKLTANSEEVTINDENFYGVDFAELVTALSESNWDLNFSETIVIDSQAKTKKNFTPQLRTPITSARLFECISSLLTKDCLVAADFGDSLFGSIDFMLPENSFISCAYFASIGFGTPAAIGAQLAAPNKKVVGIVGDGAFQMTATELSTAVRYGITPLIIVLNNHGYGTERPLLEGSFNDIQNWNYSQIPQLINGGMGIKVKTETEFQSAFQKALNDTNDFFLIEVELEKTDFSPALRRFLSYAKNK